MPPKTAAPQTTSPDLLQEWTNTPARRHAFFCLCGNSEERSLGIFWLLVQQFKTDPERTQAHLVERWFIDGDIPEDLKRGNFLVGPVNIGNAPSKVVFGPAKKYLRKTRAADFTSGGGLFGAFKMKTSGTKPPANLFDFILVALTPRLDELRARLAMYNPDGTYQPPGGAEQIQKLSMDLTLAGFNPESAGIY